MEATVEALDALVPNLLRPSATPWAGSSKVLNEMQLLKERELTQAPWRKTATSRDATILGYTGVMRQEAHT